MPHRTAAILSIGDELTLGQTLDTNSQWLSGRLTSFGITPIEHATVPDDLAATRDAIIRLATLADVVISTGGLGPTLDDLTRPALAAAMNDTLLEDPEALAQIQARFAGRPMPDLNRTQAQRPTRATILRNDWGTAPGLRAALQPNRDRKGADTAPPSARTPHTCDLFCLPGPPREMRPMFETHVAPLLNPARAIRTKSLLTFGLGESDIATRLGELMHRTRNPTVGTTASRGVIACRIRYEGRDVHDTGEHLIADTESRIRSALGPYVFGEDSDTLPSVILDLLKSRHQTLATVESCTGGLLGELITDTPGSSSIYRGGWITYINELKQQQVNVPADIFKSGGPGAVSRECAEAMAKGGLEKSGADHCLSITGIAGPDGGTPGKPVGTVWIAMCSTGMPALSRRFLFTGERANIRDWSARSALAMLRFAMIGQPELSLLRQQ